MEQIIINVLSFSFQIAGAVLLLLWSLKNSDRKIKKMSVIPGINIFDFEGNTEVDSKTLQDNAKVVYSNIVAFVDIVIGYSLAIFAGEFDINAWIMFVVVAGATTGIILLEKLLIYCVARLKYSKDQKINPDKI